MSDIHNETAASPEQVHVAQQDAVADAAPEESQQETTKIHISNDYLEKQIGDWFAKRPITMNNIIRLSVKIVEDCAAASEVLLTSSLKKHLAEKLISDYLVNVASKMLTENGNAELRAAFRMQIGNMTENVVGDIIDGIIEDVRNSSLYQRTREAVQSATEAGKRLCNGPVQKLRAKLSQCRRRRSGAAGQTDASSSSERAHVEPSSVEDDVVFEV